MPRILLPIAAAVLVLLQPVEGRTASSALELLIERPQQSLRGQVIDLDSKWNASRLLAHFGEAERAYGVLRTRAPNEALDGQVERFEARLLAEIGLYLRADSLLALQAYSGDIETYYTLYLQRARLNTLGRRYERALDFLAVIDSLEVPAFEPYKDFIALDALYQTGRFEEACAVGEKRLAKGIPSSLSPRFEEYLLDAFLGAGKLDKARRFLKVLKSRRSRSRAMAPLLVREVDLMFQLQDTLQAVRSAVDVAKNRGTRHLALGPVERVARSVRPAMMSEEALLTFCEVLLRGKSLALADPVTSELKRRSLNKSQKERRRYFIADLYYKEKRYSKSFNHVRKKFSAPSLERSATLMRARIYRKTGQAMRAAEMYVDFATRYPYDAKAAEGLLVAAGLYMRSANSKKSLELLERITKTYPSHRYARVATQKLAVYYLGRKHYSRGISILERALERSGRRKQDLLFYLAEAYGRMGKPQKQSDLLAELAEVNPVSFYLDPAIARSYTLPIMTSDGKVALEGERGMMEFLKRVFNRRQQAYDSIREKLPPLEKSSRLETNAVYLRRGRTFLQMGFRDWGEVELQVLESRRLPARVSFELGILYDDFAMHWKSVRSFQRVYYAVSGETRKELDTKFKILMYPVPYPGLVIENCSRYDIAPHLVYAMMRRESRFDLNAVSRAGAVGLMQLMPQTGEEVASRLGFPDDIRSNLLNPEINLTFGIWYASHLLGKSRDNALMMLSAYNAGFGNAKRWFAGRRTGSEAAAVVDDIDYRETRDYVKAVVEAARVYHRFYFDSRSASGGPPR